MRGESGEAADGRGGRERARRWRGSLQRGSARSSGRGFHGGSMVPETEKERIGHEREGGGRKEEERRKVHWGMELICWSGNSDLCWTRARGSGRAPARERIEGACEVGDLVDHGEEMVGPCWKRWSLSGSAGSGGIPRKTEWRRLRERMDGMARFLGLGRLNI